MHLPLQIASEFFLYHANRCGVVFTEGLVQYFRNKVNETDAFEQRLVRAQRPLPDSDQIDFTAETLAYFEADKFALEWEIDTKNDLEQLEKDLKVTPHPITTELANKREGLLVMNQVDVKEIQQQLNQADIARYNVGLLGELPQNAAMAALAAVLPGPAPVLPVPAPAPVAVAIRNREPAAAVAAMNDVIDLTLEDDEDDQSKKSGGFALNIRCRLLSVPF